MTDLTPELLAEMRREAESQTIIWRDSPIARKAFETIDLLDAVDRLERELDEARGCLEGARASATAFRKDWEECNAALTAARESQRELAAIFGFGTESNAGLNLEGALIDLDRFNADAVCRNTIRRVCKQLGEAARALAAYHAGKSEGGADA